MTIRKGDVGVAVENLQKNLNRLGANLVVDGKFGEATEEIVLHFQSAHRLQSDGAVGPFTQIAITKAIVSQLIPFEMGRAPWMEWVRARVGQAEIAGPQHNPFIVSLFNHTNFKADSDETPWCGALASAALEETGFTSPKSAAAKAFILIGTPCELVPGCIVVIQRPDGGFHVTFCDRVIDKTNFAGLGGNQTDRVRISNFSRDMIVATRWPEKQVLA